MSKVNYWFDDDCAKAFWDQHNALPYQELLRDTMQTVSPKAGQRWLDLGCGSGQLTAALWEKSVGPLGQIVAVDCAAVNEQAIAKLRRKLLPSPEPDQLRFLQGDFSQGLPEFGDNYFDGVVSGLAISYAESFNPRTGAYSDAAYNHLLAELFRVLKPGGLLVFSVNVPHPHFWRIFWKSLRWRRSLSKPGRVLLNALKMQAYGRWLRAEAERGRFHFFPIDEIRRRLRDVGFDEVRHQCSYAEQAYVIRAMKPFALVSKATTPAPHSPLSEVLSSPSV